MFSRIAALAILNYWVLSGLCDAYVPAAVRLSTFQATRGRTKANTFKLYDGSGGPETVEEVAQGPGLFKKLSRALPFTGNGEEVVEKVEEVEGVPGSAEFIKSDDSVVEAKEPSAIDKIKEAGLSGTVSYAGWEFLFWVISIPTSVLAYHQTTGEWLDLSDSEGQAKLVAFSTAFLTFARVLVPVRIALALATAPWVAKNVLPLVGKGDNQS